MALALHNISTSRDTIGLNPLPQLLQLPSGLALLEIQGTINLPDQLGYLSGTSGEDEAQQKTQETPIGRLVFPAYDPQDNSNTAWMKRVYLYVGKHQRLTGEVKKLPKSIAVIRKRAAGLSQQRNMEAEDGQEGEAAEELEIVEIVKHKIIFSSRPEPVGVYVAEN